jgi:hypothetical protein
VIGLEDHLMVGDMRGGGAGNAALQDVQPERARGGAPAPEQVDQRRHRLDSALRPEGPQHVTAGGLGDAAAQRRVIHQPFERVAPLVGAGREEARFAMADGAPKRACGGGDGGDVHQGGLEELQLALSFAERVADLQRREVDVEPRHLLRKLVQRHEVAPLDPVLQPTERRELLHVEDGGGAVRGAEGDEAAIGTRAQHRRHRLHAKREIALVRARAAGVADAHQPVAGPGRAAASGGEAGNREGRVVEPVRQHHRRHPACRMCAASSSVAATHRSAAAMVFRTRW